jgi:hypothetical protein
MRDDGGSIDPVTLIMVLCVIALFAGGIVCLVRDRTKRTAQMRNFADSHRWSFSPEDKDKSGDRLETFFLGQIFSAFKIVTIENSDGRTLRVFDTRHFYFNRSKSDQLRTGCIIGSPRFEDNGAGDGVGIFYRYGTESLWAADQFDMGSGEFSKDFVVAAKNQSAARNLVTPALQALLLRFRQTPYAISLTVGINSTGAVALIGRSASPESMLDLIELCRNIEAALTTSKK